MQPCSNYCCANADCSATRLISTISNCIEMLASSLSLEHYTVSLLKKCRNRRQNLLLVTLCVAPVSDCSASVGWDLGGLFGSDVLKRASVEHDRD